jgi:hypothetical protein
MMPELVQRQFRDAMATPDLTRELAEREYPELLQWLRDRIDLAQVIRNSGVALEPISPDAPDVLVGRGCPGCGGPVLVRGA